MQAATCKTGDRVLRRIQSLSMSIALRRRSYSRACHGRTCQPSTVECDGAVVIVNPVACRGVVRGAAFVASSNSGYERRRVEYGFQSVSPDLTIALEISAGSNI